MIYLNEKTFAISASARQDDPEFFEVDDLLALPVQTLNIKGYRTHVCCEGHFFSPPELLRLHILFDSEVDLPWDLPEGFEYKDCALMYMYRNTENLYAFSAEKVSVCERLYDWIKTL